MVEALHRHLPDVGAEERARELGRARSGPRVRARPSTFSPWIRSSTSTSSVTYGWITCGHEEVVACTPRSPTRSARRCAPPRGSRARRADAARAPRSARSAAAAARCRSASRRARPSSAAARGRARTCSTMPGRRTFTTTSRPVVSKRRVDLGDRGRRERRLVDRREVLEADLAVDHLAQRAERQRRSVVDRASPSSST